VGARAGITILVLALSLLGDAIRDAFDPKTRVELGPGSTREK
jgi:ABC-type dipeptide/oligopeptide/nickel transport system permease subunit